MEVTCWTDHSGCCTFRQLLCNRRISSFVFRLSSLPGVNPPRPPFAIPPCVAPSPAPSSAPKDPWILTARSWLASSLRVSATPRLTVRFVYYTSMARHCGRSPHRLPSQVVLPVADLATITSPSSVSCLRYPCSSCPCPGGFPLLVLVHVHVHVHRRLPLPSLPNRSLLRP